MVDWHSLKADTVFIELDSGEDGLSEGAAAKRLERHGRNEITREDGVSVLDILIGQFQDFMIFLLLGAALISLGLGETIDAALIFLIVIANGVFGFIQDYKAEKSIEALKDMSSPDASVLRDGEKRTVDAREVVPGDIVFIEQGDAIPADARLLETSSLETDESALTGESVTASKHAGTLDSETALAERDNMVYMNTTAVKGRGKALVVNTGMDTQVGDIAEQLSEADDRETPFQKEVNELGKKIGYGILGIIGFIAVIQLVQVILGGGLAALTLERLVPIFLVAVALAVAAVPEGLPAIVTLTLALGSKKMIKKNALVRRLPVVESLGSIDVIVTDKTGTLTENAMTVKRILTSDTVFEVTGSGTKTEGSFLKNDAPVEYDRVEDILRCGTLCNNAEKAPENDKKDYFGDPTEIALKVSAAKADIDVSAERLREIPFSSERKRMTVIADNTSDENSKPMAYMKGAPEVVLERCDRVMVHGEVHELTDAKREEILERNHEFAEDALRVLGFAEKEVDAVDADADEIEAGMVFLGLQGMIDPPREEVQEAVEDCRKAGIKVVMATGDNIETAKAIGKQVGFNPRGAMTGNDIDKLSDEEFAEAVEDVEVFARVSPAHKVKILKTLQDNGHKVAMTGDGVNDAPALKNADVGVAMGIRGTDVSKQASDMILMDDNFVTIRDAIAEGRGIFDNIRKFVNYLLSANAGEVLVVFFGILLGSILYPDLFGHGSGHGALILTPVMLLWINLLTDGLPALALGADPKSDNIMQRQPRNEGEGVINKRMMASIGSIGILMTLVMLPAFFHILGTGAPIEEAQTVLFTMLVAFEMVRIQTIRERYDLNIFSNTWLIAAIAASFVLQLVVLYTALGQYFNVIPPTLFEWQIIGAGFVAFFVLNVGMSKLYDRIFTDDVIV